MLPTGQHANGGHPSVRATQAKEKDIELTYFASLHLQVEIPVSWQLQGHFASGSGE